MRRLFAIIILPLVLLLFFNQTANWHLHELPNGIVVEHSHPYSNNSSENFPFQKHSHSEVELLIIGLLSSTIVLVIILFTSMLSYLPTKDKQKIQVPLFHFIREPIRLINPLRGPPSIIISI